MRILACFVAGVMCLGAIMHSVKSQEIEVGSEPFSYTRDYCHQFAVTPDGKRVAVCGYAAQSKPGEPIFKGGCVVWDIASHKRVFIGQMAAGAYRIAISPDGKTVAMGGDTGIVPRGNGDYEGSVELKLFNVDTGKRSPNLDGHLTGFGTGTLAFTRDNKYLVSTAEDNIIRVWTVADNKPYAKFCFKADRRPAFDWQNWSDRPHEKPKISVVVEPKIDRVWGFALSPKSDAVAVASGTKDVILLDVNSAKEINSLSCKNITKSRQVGFSPDGTLMFVWGWVKNELDFDTPGNHVTEVWQVEPRKLIGVFEDVCTQPGAISNDNNNLVGCDRQGIGTWDIKMQRFKLRLLTNDHNNNWIMRDLAFLPNGGTLLLATGNLIANSTRGIQFWDIETAKKIELQRK